LVSLYDASPSLDHKETVIAKKKQNDIIRDKFISHKQTIFLQKKMLDRSQASILFELK
jgi:hypothetical protein